jgi:microcompartment protein CcmK/EutM
MLIGRVLGSVVATQKDARLAALKLLVVRVHDQENAPTDSYVVAVDAVQAGPGDIVLFATGSSARQTELTENRPCDAVIMAVVDSWDLEGCLVYDRSGTAAARE